MKKAYILITSLLLALGLQAQTVTPTWEVSFDNKSDLDGFTIIDANGDSHVYEGILRGGWSWLSHEEVSGAASYYYDRNNAADDWLITPGINLNSGREYSVSFDANAANIYPERFEVFFGNAATVDGMTKQLIAPTVVNKGEFENFRAQFAVEETGVYYVGIHAISDKGQYILDIKNLKVEAGLLANAPACVTDFTVTADPSGLKKTTIAFTLPTVQNNGEALSTITKVDVLRDGVSVKTIDTAQPGEQVSFTEMVPDEGLYKYTVIVYNENGDGAPAMKNVFVGYDAPTPPGNPHIVDKFSSIDIVWEQSLGQNGGLIKRSDMNYYIYAVDEDGNVGNRLATVEKGKLLYNIPMNTEVGEQHLITYAMIAGNSKGLSERVETKGFLVGKPLDYPFAEHFAGQGIDNFWWVSGSGLGFENQYAGFSMAKNSAEGDNGSLLFEGFFDDDVVTLHSAKVSLEGAEHPWLTFNHKAMIGTEVEMSVVAARPDGVCDILRTIDYRSYDAKDWTPELIDLDAYKSEKYVVIEFVFKNHSDEKATITYLDNIKIGEVEDEDLTTDFDCPPTIVAGNELTHSTIIQNFGTKAVTLSVTSNVSVSDETLDSNVKELTLQPMQKQIVSSAIAVPYADAGKQYAVSVKVEMIKGDGTTELAAEHQQTVKVTASTVPTVTDLLGISNPADGTVTLSWNAPENPSLKVSEGFESYEPFLTEGIGEWTTTDKDGGVCEQLFMGYPTGLENQSFAFTTFSLAALNPGMTDTNPEFTAHAGNTCLAAFFCHDGYFNYRDQNNWLISPRLSGKSQKITLYAGNYDVSSPEVFEIMYSMTDDQPESFIRIGAERRVADGQWHPFTATLPAGAQYFAIHHYTDADNAYMLKLDDITLDKALEIEAYDIYLNGELVGSTTDSEYVLNSASLNDNVAVAVRYTDKSVSEPVSVSITDGIKDVNADTSANDRIYNLAGQRITSRNATRRGEIIIINGNKQLIYK